MIPKQAELGVPHSDTQVELQSYFNWGQVLSVGRDTTHTLFMGGTIGVGTPYNNKRKFYASGGWVDGWLFLQKIKPHRNSHQRVLQCKGNLFFKGPRSGITLCVIPWEPKGGITWCVIPRGT